MSPARCSICPSRSLWSSPSIARTAAGAGLRRQTRAGFPDGVNAPVQYGPRIAAFVVYLLHYQLLPEKRLARLMADLFGVAGRRHHRPDEPDLCRTLPGLCRRRCATWSAAAVKHLDETGFRIGGKTQWLHVASTVLLTFYRVSARRGSLLADVTGIVVHDHWKPYYTLTACCMRCATPTTCAN